MVLDNHGFFACLSYYNKIQYRFDLFASIFGIIYVWHQDQSNICFDEHTSDYVHVLHINFDHTLARTYSIDNF